MNLNRVGLALFLASLATAAAAEPPVRQVCDQADSGERIKCKMGNIVEQQRGLAAKVGQSAGIPEEQKRALSRAVEGAEKARHRADPSEFKHLTRKSKVACQTREIIGDGKGDDDGVCKGNEDCAEVIGDQIGDDDGICSPRNGKKREACVEVCDAEAVDDDPENFDDDPNADSRGRDIEESLDGVTDQFEQLNAVMGAGELLPASAARLSALGVHGACTTFIDDRPPQWAIDVVMGAQIAADGVRALADVNERFCDQTIFGFNGASVCAVVEGIAGGARIVASILEGLNTGVDRHTIDAIWDCLQETSNQTAVAVGAVAGDLSAVGANVGAVDAKVNAVAQQLEHVQGTLAAVQTTLANITALLNAPPGQRTTFPTKP
jgi:hypothetical protein